MSNKNQANYIQPVSVIQETIAAYIFWILSFFVVILLVIFLKEEEGFNVGLNRAGIILQLLAGLSIIPQILSSDGKEKVDNFLKRLEKFLNRPNKLTRLLFSLITIVAIVIAGWFSLIVVGSEFLKPIVFFIFGVFVVAELLSLLFGLVLKTRLGTEKFAIHLAVLQYLISLLRLGIEKIILQLSLPIFVVGCILQLLSTYTQ
jgi:hypothetical protein